MESATMTHSDEIGEIAKALCLAQVAFPTIPKTRKARLPNGVEYHYCDITDMFKVIMPILSKHGLCLLQSAERVAGTSYMSSMVVHAESGQWIKSLVPMIVLGKPKRGGGFSEDKDMQCVGTASTYAKRYGMAQLLGLVTDEDHDGSLEPEPVQAQPAKAPPPSAGAHPKYDNDESIPF